MDLNTDGLAFSCLISLGYSSASGFLMEHGKVLYLVTAKHVLFDGDKLVNDEIEITCMPGRITDNSVHRLRVDLRTNPPVYSKEYDVAIIHLGHSDWNYRSESYGTTLGIGVETIERSKTDALLITIEHIKNINMVNIGADIFLFGYPTSLGSSAVSLFDKTRPLLRKGIVANINKKTNSIILDCAVYPGNSGGPVLEVHTIKDKKHYFLIGVVSKFIPYEQSWVNMRDRIKNIEYLNSGYSVATSMDVVLDLMENN